MPRFLLDTCSSKDIISFNIYKAKKGIFKGRNEYHLHSVSAFQPDREKAKFLHIEPGSPLHILCQNTQSDQKM